MSNESALKINPDRTTVEIDGTPNPITFGDVLNPGPEYKIHIYSFQGEKGTQADGCVFEIMPYGSTTVMRVVEETVAVQEVAIQGHGWFLGVSPAGEMILQEVGGDILENPLAQLKKGWVGVWVAGENGLEVLDVTEPPFKPSMETPVERNDQAMPPGFWEKYDSLKTPVRI